MFPRDTKVNMNKWKNMPFSDVRTQYSLSPQNSSIQCYPNSNINKLFNGLKHSNDPQEKQIAEKRGNYWYYSKKHDDAS